MEDGEIVCAVAVEHLGWPAAPSRRLLREARVTLGRDERGALALRVCHPGAPPPGLLFPLRPAEVRLFTRFAKDGKASLRLAPPSASAQPHHLQLLLSNCPPERLRRFLRTLRLKLRARSGAAGDTRRRRRRRRLLAGRPRSFDPVAEIQQVKKMWSTCSRATLSQEQSMVLNAVLGGKSVFFTGSAGTGKSYLLKRIVALLPPNGTYPTASTGVAACQIGGTTLHAFAGIGSGKAPLSQCIELAQRSGIRQQWLNCRRLIIDEISMVEGDFFDKLEAVARNVRKCEDPFGGIQLIICGDFLQLPPVTKATEQPKFCFQAKSWRKCIHLNMELTEVRRQTDREFISLLNAVRLGRCTEDVTRQLTLTATHRVERDGILATRLCTHKDDVELTNTRQLQELPGAQVMLTKNLDVSRGLVNGARGVVIGFETEGRGLPKGMSLDCAEISLARVFEYGQAYVALSRARSLLGLRVLDFDPKVVRANPYVLQFYRQLRRDKFLTQDYLNFCIQANKENVEGT
ncbi:hypothetical protein JD844_018160 [Phrynosoma platyrhinos]|uniref:ATP-dependent DNA helicase n=1 Tax=Phrynosoma platyrhinos TaxID=52577 RepID=A0ABQ7SN18_PHRPL|nr:hypothetical protein JD844_018160 [Phrynosoma platyrhinos]